MAGGFSSTAHVSPSASAPSIKQLPISAWASACYPCSVARVERGIDVRQRFVSGRREPVETLALGVRVSHAGVVETFELQHAARRWPAGLATTARACSAVNGFRRKACAPDASATRLVASSASPVEMITPHSGIDRTQLSQHVEAGLILQHHVGTSPGLAARAGRRPPQRRRRPPRPSGIRRPRASFGRPSAEWPKSSTIKIFAIRSSFTRWPGCRATGDAQDT